MNLLANVNFLAGDTLLEKMIEDLWKLTNSPHKLQNESIVDFKYAQVLFVALQKRRLSSTNIKQGIDEERERSLKATPESLCRDWSLSMEIKTSMHKIKSWGDRGSPCLSPWEGLNHGVGFFF